MKKLFKIMLSTLLVLGLCGCGGEKQESENNQQEPSMDISIDQKDTSLEAIEEAALKTIADDTLLLSNKLSQLENEIDTYDEYVEQRDEIFAYYQSILENHQALTIKLRKYAVSYAEFILSSDLTNDEKYEAFDDFYDVIYDDCGDELYDAIYDGLFDDAYDTFYDGVLDDKEDDVEYSEWYDYRSDEYNALFDIKSEVYDDYSDYRSDVYDLRSDLRSELWDDDLERAQKKLEKFKANIGKQQEAVTEDIKEDDKQDASSKTESNDKTGSSMSADFKAAMDSYEAFFDEYIAFMKKYEETDGSDLSLLADYAQYLSKYSEYMSDLEKWENEDLNTAEAAYYLQVQSRINQKLLEVTIP